MSIANDTPRFCTKNAGNIMNVCTLYTVFSRQIAAFAPPHVCTALSDVWRMIRQTMDIGVCKYLFSSFAQFIRIFLNLIFRSKILKTVRTRN